MGLISDGRAGVEWRSECDGEQDGMGNVQTPDTMACRCLSCIGAGLSLSPSYIDRGRESVYAVAPVEGVTTRSDADERQSM